MTSARRARFAEAFDFALLSILAISIGSLTSLFSLNHMEPRSKDKMG